MKATRTTVRAFLLLIATVLILTAIVVAQPPKQDAPRPGAYALSKEDDQAIRKTVASFEEAWNLHDMKALARVFREDAEWVNIVGMHWRGRDAIVAAHTAFHETMFKNTRVKTDALETRSLGNGVAIAVATETVDSFTTPDGRVMPKAQDRLTYVLAKGPEGWKIAHGHNVVVDAAAAKHNPVKDARK
ncbi:MAG: SgcJ/EcaC family oxidoreductase [Planctomycetia bacterium]|nr:SgcJ/EcaC family oxidoreductase [Planctomycetia bacterium]